MKQNKLEKQKHERHNFRQHAKHAKLHSELLLGKMITEGTFDSSGFSPAGPWLQHLQYHLANLFERDCRRTGWNVKQNLSVKLWSLQLEKGFLYAWKSWTLTAELQRRIQAPEMRCYRKRLHITYTDHVANEEIRAKIQQAIGPHENLLTIVKRRKLQWYGHVSRLSGLVKTILQGTVKWGRRQGGQRKRWEDNIR